VKKSHSTASGGIRCDILFRSILRMLRKNLSKKVKKAQPSICNSGKKMEDLKMAEGIRKFVH
jgi:hypothetical protein